MADDLRIRVTTRAAQVLREAIGQGGGKRVRILKVGGGPTSLELGLKLTAESLAGDRTVERDGVTFCVDAATAPHLQGLLIDYEAGAFVFRRERGAKAGA